MGKGKIILGVIVLLGIIGGAYFLGTSKRELRDTDLAQFQKEYKQAVTQEHIEQSDTLKQEKKQRFIDTQEGIFIAQLFDELAKGFKVTKRGKEYDAEFSDKLLDKIFVRNSGKHPFNGDDRWIYSKGLDLFGVTLLLDGKIIERIGSPLASNKEVIKEGLIIDGTILFRQAESGKYFIVPYHAFIVKKKDNYMVIETDFVVGKITAVLPSDIDLTKSRYADL